MAQKVNCSSQNRTELSKVAPLNTPFAVHIFPSYFCNFKCVYCIHSLKENELSEILKKQLMSFDTFKKAMEGMENFQRKLKLLNFAGHGEPLLNRDLPKMIDYAAKLEISEKIEVVTNAFNLTEPTSDALINAGLNSIRISIQGMTAGKYKEISGVEIDFQKFVRQIEYFYRNRQTCKVYIKIIDHALKDENEMKGFYELFGNISDYIAIEHLVPTASGVDYDSFGVDYTQTQQGFNRGEIEACPMPFYMIIVEPNGDIRTCCATRFPILLGNVNDVALSKVWNSNLLEEFWRMHLNGGRRIHSICRSCSNPEYGVQPEDKIDLCKDIIIERINNSERR